MNRNNRLRYDPHKDFDWQYEADRDRAAGGLPATASHRPSFSGATETPEPERQPRRRGFLRRKDR